MSRLADALPAEGRLLGIDYGRVRIGVAVSDGLRLTGNAHSVLDAGAADLTSDIAAIIDEYGVSGVVVGLPVSIDGTLGEMAEEATAFAERLAGELPVPVTLYDERYSSRMAERVLLQADSSRAKRKATIDKVAAAVMLQGYLDRAQHE